MRIRLFSVLVSFCLFVGMHGPTTANAELAFVSMDGTWWKISKYMDKGYLFLNPPQQVLADKPKKYKDKPKAGYFYFPSPSLNLDGTAYINVSGFFFYPEAGWVATPILTFTIMGGTPNDFACLYFEEPGIDSGRMIVMQTRLTEDKKTLGTIKSGKMSTLGSAIYTQRDGEMFVGKNELKAKWVPEDKVPQEVKDLVPAPPIIP